MTVPGTPRGKARPRVVRVKGRTRTHTADETVAYEDRVRAAWMQAGRVDLGDRPLAVKIVAYHARPKSHYRTDGTLSAKGLREFAPMKTPDCDNVTKVVLDALNQLAYGDDKQVVRQVFERRWTASGDRERVTVHLATVPAP